jgi:hypothetical protein
LKLDHKQMSMKNNKSNLLIIIVVALFSFLDNGKAIAATKVLYEVKISHEFSNVNLRDTFKLTVTGSERVKDSCF